MSKVYSVTRDTSANLKKLRQLEKNGLIKIYEVVLENKVKKANKKILPIAVFDHSNFDECVFAGGDCVYNQIRKIIGKHNVKDAMHLEAHIRNKFDFFITGDLDEFIKNGKRKKLESSFAGLKILTVEELEKLIT